MSTTVNNQLPSSILANEPIRSEGPDFRYLGDNPMHPPHKRMDDVNHETMFLTSSMDYSANPNFDENGQVPPTRKLRVAVVGSGLAGLTVAHLLSSLHSGNGHGDVGIEVELFEKAHKLGKTLICKERQGVVCYNPEGCMVWLDTERASAVLYN